MEKEHQPGTPDRPGQEGITQRRIWDFMPGDHVAYIPDHADSDIRHKDVQFGIVSSVGPKFVFVRFFPQIILLGFRETTGQACKPEQLAYYDERHEGGVFRGKYL